MARLSLPWLALWLCSACSSPSAASADGSQTGGEQPGAGCPSPSDPMEPVEASAHDSLGFSANQVLAALATRKAGPLLYASGATSPLSVGVTYVGPTNYDTRCKLLDLAVSLTFQTADHSFDEQLPASLAATTANDAFIDLEQVPVSELHGSMLGTALPEYSGASVYFEITFSASGVRGVVSGRGAQAGKPPGNFAIATF